jgi:exonuclease SbcC
MITSLDITDFQAHRKLTVDLDQPITSIIGPSDHGKSAILRAIRWLFLNESPEGDFINWAGSKAIVRATVDGHVIEREANKSGNVYRLDGQEYKAFGRKVPEDIANFLNVSSLNFQEQDEPNFWFWLSPAEVSRQLNQIVNLELIDQTNTRLDSKLRQTRTILADRKEQYEAAREERKRLRFVPEIAAALEEVKGLRKTAEDAEEKVTGLSDSIETLTEKQDEIRQGKAALSDLEDVIELGKAASEKNRQASTLRALLAEADSLATTASLSAPNVEELGKLAQSAVELGRKAQGLAGILAYIETIETGLDQDKWELKQAEAEIKELTKGKCPLCGGNLKS